MRILLVEDEEKISKYIKCGLEEQGYAVDVAFTGLEALGWVSIVDFDIIILDILLPELDGLSVCKEIRRRGLKVPILILTARDTVNDRVVGLDAGADDYLIKPFAFKELLARLRALARRSNEVTKSPVLQIGDLELNTSTQKAKRGGRPIKLANKEYAVLECMLREPERVFSRTQIMEHVWNYDVFNQSNIVDVYIRNLRRKIDDPFEVKLIHTVRGSGYCISVNREWDESN